MTRYLIPKFTPKRDKEFLYISSFELKSQTTTVSTMGRGGNSVNAQTKGKKRVIIPGRNVPNSEQTQCVREAWMGDWRELARSILARSALARAFSSRVYQIKAKQNIGRQVTKTEFHTSWFVLELPLC